MQSALKVKGFMVLPPADAVSNTKGRKNKVNYHNCGNSHTEKKTVICYAAKCNNIDAKCNKMFNAKCNNLSTQIVITFLTHNVITQNVIISE